MTQILRVNVRPALTPTLRAVLSDKLHELEQQRVLVTERIAELQREVARWDADLAEIEPAITELEAALKP